MDKKEFNGLVEDDLVLLETKQDPNPIVADDIFVAREYLQRACRICHESLAPHASRSPIFREQMINDERSDEICLTKLPSSNSSSKNKKSDIKGGDYEMIAPCRCKGTMKWVHRMCLDNWRAACYRTEAYRKCEQCHTEYQLEDGWGSSLFRNRQLMNALALLGMAIWGLLSCSIIEGGRNFGTILMMDGFIRDLAYLQHSYHRFVNYSNFPSESDLYYDYDDEGELYYKDPPKYTNQIRKSIKSHNHSKGEYSRAWTTLLVEGALGIAATEVLIVNVSFPLVINLLIILYRTLGYTSCPTYFDYTVLTVLLSLCIYYAYRDMLRWVALIVRKLTCTRIRNLAE